jgi:hypothetical protein
VFTSSKNFVYFAEFCKQNIIGYQFKCKTESCFGFLSIYEQILSLQIFQQQTVTIGFFCETLLIIYTHIPPMENIISDKHIVVKKIESKAQVMWN